MGSCRIWCCCGETNCSGICREWEEVCCKGALFSSSVEDKARVTGTCMVCSGWSWSTSITEPTWPAGMAELPWASGTTFSVCMEPVEVSSSEVTPVGVVIRVPALAARASAMSTSGWLLALWATTLSFFSNFLPQMLQENWYVASASCFFMCQFREAFWRQVKPQISHLERKWDAWNLL